MKWLRFVLICAALFCFSGCIDYLEEIWINADGSGKLKVDMGIAETFVSMGKSFGMEDSSNDMQKQYLKKKEELEKNPNVQKVDFKDFTQGDMHHFVFDIDVKDIFKVGELTRKLEMSQMETQGQQDTAGKSEVRIEKLPNGNIQFVQLFKGEKKESSSQGMPMGEQGDSSGVNYDSMGQAMAMSMFGDKGVTIRVHGPSIVSSNGKIDDEKKMVEWKIGLAEMSKGSFSKELNAEIELSHSSNALMITIIVVVALLVLVIAMMVLKMRGKQRPA